MNGKKLWLILFALAFFIMGCSSKNNDELQEQELTKLIDTRDYHSVLAWFDTQTDAQTREKFKVYQAYAYMGLGGLEPLDLALRVRGEQNFSDSQLKYFFAHCPNVVLGPSERNATKCMTLRLFNNLPETNQPDLQKALSIFRELHSNHKLQAQDALLASFLETCMVLAQLRSAFLMYAHLDAYIITHEQAADIFNQINEAAIAMKQWVAALKQDKNLLSEKITGLKNMSLFKNQNEDEFNFVEGTGLPILLRVSSMSDESTYASIGRNSIILALDQALTFFEE